MNEPWKSWPKQPARPIYWIADPGTSHLSDGMSRPQESSAEAHA
jgi:hypothetical protein